MRSVELLSPAGNFESLRAAVQNGADAVYLGGRGFGARAQASNFSGDSLKEAVEYCHLRDVKVYITLNTLVKDQEFGELYEVAKEAVGAGVDAVLAQDLGVVSFLQGCFPGIELHASTQMSINNLSGALFAKGLGLKRVVAARECDADALLQMSQAGIEIESFCHGALCAGFSGQCLMSSLIGGRSGNRGRCAQPCRHAYKLGGEGGYFLSTRDICMAYDLRTLLDAGVCALKIEGRLKRPEYVAIVTKAYRSAIDLALEGRLPQDAYMEELSAVYNRGGFTRGYAMEKADGDIYFPQRPNHMGVYAGMVLRVSGGKALVRAEKPLHKGDGLEARGIRESAGISIESIKEDEGGVWINVPPQVKPSMQLYRTTDEIQMQAARESYTGENRQRKMDMAFFARVGEPCRLQFGDIWQEGETVQAAAKKPLSRERVLEQLLKLGDSVYMPGEVLVEMDEDAFLPVSAINALRRAAIAKMDERVLEEARPKVEVLGQMKPDVRNAASGNRQIVHRSESIAALLASTECELQYAPRDLRPESLKADLERLKEKNAYLVLPPFLTQQELAGIVSLLKEAEIGAVANNVSQIEALQGMDWIAGEGLNCFNAFAADMLLKLKAKRITASLECTLEMAGELAQRAPIDIKVYGELPAMYLRSCPLRAQKGLGKAGRETCMLCKREGYQMTDRLSNELPLRPYYTQNGCTVVVYNPSKLDALQRRNQIDRFPFASLVVEEDGDVKKSMAHESENDGGKFTYGHLFRGVE